MKLLFLNVTGAVGGAERLLLDLFASLKETSPGCALHLLLGQDGPLAGRAQAAGAVVSVLPLPEAVLRVGDSAAGTGRLVRLAAGGLSAGWAAWRYAGRLRAAVNALRPDIVHSNSLKYHLLSALAGVRPLVWHLHDFIGARPLMSRLLTQAARRAAGAVAISEAVAADAAEWCQLPVRVLLNAVDTDTFAPGDGDGAWLDGEAGLPPAAPGTVRVGLVAAYARWKGQDVFLRAAARLKERGAPVRFYVVGGPIYHTRNSQWTLDELRALAGPLVHTGDVGFVGFRSDTTPVYRALDVVVHASTRPEPFGLTIAEAMACGRAVVVARAGGAAELFTHDRDAVGVAPGNAEALASVLGELSADPLRRRSLGEQARATALRCFDRARLGRQLLAAYADLVPATRSPAPALQTV